MKYTIELSANAVTWYRIKDIHANMVTEALIKASNKARIPLQSIRHCNIKLDREES